MHYGISLQCSYVHQGNELTRVGAAGAGSEARRAAVAGNDPGLERRQTGYECSSLMVHVFALCALHPRSGGWADQRSGSGRKSSCAGPTVKRSLLDARVPGEGQNE